MDKSKEGFIKFVKANYERNGSVWQHKTDKHNATDLGVYLAYQMHVNNTEKEEYVKALKDSLKVMK